MCYFDFFSLLQWILQNFTVLADLKQNQWALISKAINTSCFHRMCENLFVGKPLFIATSGAYSDSKMLNLTPLNVRFGNWLRVFRALSYDIRLASFLQTWFCRFYAIYTPQWPLVSANQREGREIMNSRGIDEYINRPRCSAVLERNKMRLLISLSKGLGGNLLMDLYASVKWQA